jgi:hypothetical protein
LCVFFIFVFPSLCEQALSAEPIWNLISVNPNQLWTLHKKPNGPSKGLGQANQPASQGGVRWALFSSIISNTILSSCYVGGHLSQSVCLSIHPSVQERPYLQDAGVPICMN